MMKSVNGQYCGLGEGTTVEMSL